MDAMLWTFSFVVCILVLMRAVQLAARERRAGMPWRAREMMTYYGVICAVLVVPNLVLLTPVAPMGAAVGSIVLALLGGVFFWRS